MVQYQGWSMIDLDFVTKSIISMPFRANNPVASFSRNKTFQSKLTSLPYIRWQTKALNSLLECRKVCRVWRYRCCTRCLGPLCVYVCLKFKAWMLYKLHTIIIQINIGVVPWKVVLEEDCSIAPFIIVLARYYSIYPLMYSDIYAIVFT